MAYHDSYWMKHGRILHTHGINHCFHDLMCRLQTRTEALEIHFRSMSNKVFWRIIKIRVQFALWVLMK